jgi:D-beta-D-heptose 7-phosphate kinase/D-beta-D-heptose 1-phosphate adenosyltransferase
MRTPGIIVPSFGSAHVVVAGDVMLDRYWYGTTSRISPEAPVPAVHVQDVEERPGGAGNVAVNIAALGGRVTLFGVTGDDEAADTLAELLRAQDVESRLDRRPQRPTITKLRVVSRHQQLIRLDFEDLVKGGELAADGLDWIAALQQAGAVVLSDYGKGALHDMQAFIRQARSRGCAVLVDPKGGDFSRYRGATIITPNLAEFELVVGECRDLDDLVEKGMALCRDVELDGLLVTRSEHGMTLLRPGEAPLHLPTNAREVFDVTGAGDTVIGVLAAALAAGQPMPAATALANLAAGIVVGKLGTAKVTVPELRAVLHEHAFIGRGVMDEAGVLEMVAAARAKGETVVMTNGCFDILHAGHVRYLHEAKAMGDRLIVAVNDDASVNRLKGHDRPINPLSRRMAVLDALASVDWVVPFSEDTPERLICAVGPDVLVKGGDYHPDQIAGAGCVQGRGGRVVVLGYEEGASTTSIIEAIHRSAQHKESGVEAK